jgi:hypothetical protein
VSTDRTILRELLAAVEAHLDPARTDTAVPYLALRSVRDRAVAHLATTVEPVCSCGTPGLDYDGPVVDCDVHGSPSAAFAAGRREGAQDERDQARIRGDLCRWCYRTPIAGERHGHMIPAGQDGSDPEVVCLDRDGELILHSMTDPCPWGEQPGDPWAQLARDSARRERAAYAAGRAAGAAP